MPSKSRYKKEKQKAVSAVKKDVTPIKSNSQQDLYIWGMALVIVCISLIRLRLSGIPLERDEGEYAYMGRLILDGLAPYKEAYNMKLPGTYFMYAILMGIFGETISGIHIGLLLINAVTMAFFFFGFRKLFNSSIAFFAASVYGLMSLSDTMLGFAAHATHFVSFFVSIGILFLAKFYEKQNLRNAFVMGLLFGLSFLMKQQAVFFILFGGLTIILFDVFEKPIKFLRILKFASIYSVGVIFPYAITVLIFKLAGAFDKFWFWTVEYASKYATGVSFKDGKMLFNLSFQPMWEEFKFFWLLFFAGLALVFFTKFSLKQKLVAFTFALFAFLTVCPGFYFRQHYFISFLPAVGLLGAISLDFISTFLARLFKKPNLFVLSFIVFCLCFIAVLSGKKDYYMQSEPDEISKTVYGNNPFVESKEIGRFIKENSAATDKIAVVGSEPQIYLYADRMAATGYLYTYGLVELHSYNKKMQEEMIAEIEKVKPKFIVFCNIGVSWVYHAGAPTLIFDWSTKYVQQYYEVAGIADEVSNFQTDYKWNDEAKNYQPKGKEYVTVYKRK